MSEMLLAPRLSLGDPRDRSEGGIDPLGLYPIADALGVRLIPGVRERQSHPRFLTAIAVSRMVCSELEEQSDTADASIPPWLAFEWYYVEGQVKLAKSPGEYRGLPGSLKTQQAQRDGVPLSPARYLKSPAIFGWHGIYRLLARTLGIVVEERPGEAGFELLRIWEHEQQLPGFTTGQPGEGARLRKILRDAVADGCARKATCRSNAWEGWAFFRKHLGIYNAGPRERNKIWRLLEQDAQGHRREVLAFLTSPEGQALWEQGASGPLNERPVHAALNAQSRPALQTLLQAISTYEEFCRYVQDAFDECRARLAHTNTRIPLQSLSDGPAVTRASDQAPKLFPHVREQLQPFHLDGRFEEQFRTLGELAPSSLDWLTRLINHHVETQHFKPPEGKASWFDRFDDGGLILRPLYRDPDIRPRGDDSYVHAYRTGSLWSFAQDLSRVPS